MKRSALLVTSDGQRVLPETDAFFATLARLVPGSDPIGFAVRDLGFIKFHQGDQAVTTIEFDPRNVDRRALLRAERQIRDCGASAFCVKTIGASHTASPPLSAAEAVGHLRERRVPPDKPAAGRFTAQPLDYPSLLRNADDPFCRLGRKWCSAFGAFDSSVMDFAGDHDLLSRMMVFAVRPRTEEVVFRYIGEGHRWLTRHYRSDPIGDTLDSQPDKEYAAWVSQFHRVVARSGEPCFDTVAATLRFGAEPAYDVRYERLLLPWKSASDESLVTLVSRVTWRSTDEASAAAN